MKTIKSRILYSLCKGQVRIANYSQQFLSCSFKGPGKRRHIVGDHFLLCGHIVADTNVYPFAHASNICCEHKLYVQDTKKVCDFVQKRSVSATNVSQFAQPKKHHGQQCVRNNVSSFTRALRFGGIKNGDRRRSNKMCKHTALT